MLSIIKRVWQYKTFAELSPEAAERAIQDDTLFSTEVSWGQSMDPNLVNTLYHPDGQPTLITVSERARKFPRPFHV